MIVDESFPAKLFKSNKIIVVPCPVVEQMGGGGGGANPISHRSN